VCVESHDNVDHSALVYLVSKASLTGKLAWWTLLSQEYELDIVHRPGEQHVVADYLSRLESREASAGVADDFPDARVVTVTPETRSRDDPDRWLTDIIHFLSHDVPSEELSKAERKRLGVRSRAFNMMNNSLYHKSADRLLRHVVRKDEQEDVLRECLPVPSEHSPCLPSILRNRTSSAGSRKPPPPTLSSRIISSMNLCPMPAGFRKDGSDATPFLRSSLPFGKGAATGLTFRSTVLYFVFTRAVRPVPSVGDGRQAEQGAVLLLYGGEVCVEYGRLLAVFTLSIVGRLHL
jgi:hypothetical protein